MDIAYIITSGVLFVVINVTPKDKQTYTTIKTPMANGTISNIDIEKGSQTRDPFLCSILHSPKNRCY